MKKILFILLLILFSTTLSIQAYSQTQKPGSNIYNEEIINESDTVKNQKFKTSGYIQAQFEANQRDLVPEEPLNTFYIRRARMKFTFDALDGVKLVIQPDFRPGDISIKDAYTEIQFPKIRNITFLAGKFKRPGYESGTGSDEKEMLERSRILKDIYPGQRDIGMKIEYNNSIRPLNLQIALLNGNLDESEVKDVDPKKDIMALASYSLNVPNSGIILDFGFNFYSGGLKAISTKYISDFYGAIDSIALGDYLNRNWYSVEMQIFIDLLGGVALKGEYIKGENAYDVDNDLPGSQFNPYRIRSFSGCYFYFIKNIGLRNKLIVRYDYFDPNTNLSGEAANNDVWYKTSAFAFEHLYNRSIKFALSYEIPKNEISKEMTRDLNDNIFRARIQAVF